MNEQTKPGDWTRHWALSDKFGLDNDRVEAKAYTSPEIFEAEREKIFRKAWLPVAREEEVPENGDFIRCEVYPLQTQALIVRGKDGELRAFHNTCIHRGTELVSECQGRTSAFICPYHAWSFGLDGKLRGVPGKEYFPQVEIGKSGLTPIHLATWNGFIFLNFDEQPEQFLPEFLGEIGTLMDDLPFGDFPHVVELTWDIDANWKSLMEASNEAYHVGALHQWTLRGQLCSTENPQNNGYDAIFSGAHATATIQANAEWQPNMPVVNFVYEGEAFRGQPGGVTEQGTDAGGSPTFIGHRAVNRIGLPSMSTESILLFPFTCIQLLANRFIWFQYWPIAADKTRFVLRVYLQAPPTSYREAFAEAHMATYSRDIASEDAWTTATQYRSLKSGGISEVFLGENECVLRHFHKMIAEYLAK